MFASFFNNLLAGHPKFYLKPVKYKKGDKYNYSSKVTLPYDMLSVLSRDEFYRFPYVFEIAHEDGVMRTSCSVADFTLESDEVHVPIWMYEQLGLDTAEEVILNYIRLEKGTGIKLQPHSTDFLEVENPKAELEKGLADYHVISYGDEILLNFEDIGNIRFTVTQIYPEHLDSLYLVDTDLNVDFDEPIGYQKKIKDEKTVLKYVQIDDSEKSKGNGPKAMEMSRIGLFLDWDNINKI